MKKLTVVTGGCVLFGCVRNTTWNDTSIRSPEIFSALAESYGWLEETVQSAGGYVT